MNKLLLLGFLSILNAHLSAQTVEPIGIEAQLESIMAPVETLSAMRRLNACKEDEKEIKKWLFVALKSIESLDLETRDELAKKIEEYFAKRIPDCSIYEREVAKAKEKEANLKKQN